MTSVEYAGVVGRARGAGDVHVRADKHAGGAWHVSVGTYLFTLPQAEDLIRKVQAARRLALNETSRELRAREG
jgi:hypothetical protein